jgi:hypothetical protein
MTADAPAGAPAPAGARLSVALPVRVQGFDPDGARWEEMTTSEDVSAADAVFVLRHPAVKGQALLLSLPLPKRFRSYDLMSPSYRVFALVRSVEIAEEGFRLGMVFIGKNAPRGYEENPGIRYRLPGEARPSRPERRGEPRFQVFLTLKMRRDGDARDGTVEHTVAENLSRSGARVPTSLVYQTGDIVVLEEIGGDFTTRAEVRNVVVGKDNVRRLSLKSLDRKIPDRLIGS